MTELIFSQVSLWVILGLIFAAFGGYGLYRYRHQDDPSPAWVIGGVLLLLVMTIYGVGIRYGSDIDDYCVINGHVQHAVYEEEWTEEYWDTETYTTTDSEGRTTTHTRQVRRTRYHPPSWTVHTSVGSWGISSGRYQSYVKWFGNQTMTDDGHYDQVSHGDGRTFQTRWMGNREKLIPVSTTMSVVNWVKASKGTVYKSGGADIPVLSYPQIYEAERGPKLPRVLLQGVKPSSEWQKMMEWDMDVLADEVGDSKECNPILYITNQGISQVEAIKQAWVGGKKNDVILVLGVTQWPSIEWVGVISWTKDMSLEPQLRMALQGTSLEDRAGFMKILERGIKQNFTRTSMSEFEYLKFEIEIPNWIWIVSCILAVVGGVIVVWVEHTQYNRFSNPFILRRIK